MARITPEALKEVQEALKGYRNVCDEKLGTPNSKWTYKHYAELFVRWLNGEFGPGDRRKHSD